MLCRYELCPHHYHLVHAKPLFAPNLISLTQTPILVHPYCHQKHAMPDQYTLSPHPNFPSKYTSKQLGSWINIVCLTGVLLKTHAKAVQQSVSHHKLMEEVVCCSSPINRTERELNSLSASWDQPFVAID
jgi:hypothetical protein